MSQVSDSKRETSGLKGFGVVLQDLQSNLQGFEMFSDGLMDPAVPVPDGVVGRNGEKSEKRYGVYRNNVMASLIDATAANFPAVHDLVGRDYFRALAAEFIRAHPPEQPVLSEFGGKFSQFVADFPPLAKYPYLKDVAMMEWAWLTVYHAADHTGIAPDALTKIDPSLLGDAVFTAIPASALIYSPFPLSEIWKQNRSESVDGFTPEADQAILICRPDMDVTLTGLAQDVAVFADLLFFGKTLGEAAEAVSSRYECFDLSQALGCLLTARVFASVDIKT
ncbi:DNA-binding domain-containing protein [Pseudovibrio sp. Tun.PSC04-5.I4]|uniref:HvfC/BufC N-terminal domain-containing protein n=1 Tax=Pseudovibrio sp. Tun.PSC04-5.I4 TaxID=1798213 RepID=UPI000890879E|nr:DNA-binding domain-containing protein [Pseudovibrio sp. Tun.PSC04-5.I4]SDR32072.1 Putative DNA-binding domain-containing protein [Pseudovibrio sp. Tun.PSC04-5.I4]